MQGAGIVGLALVGGCLAPSPQGKGPARVYRLGYLGRRQLPEPLAQGLRELGYVEGQHYVVEYRDAGDRADQSPALAAELVALQVDVIIAPGSIPVDAAKRATATIPIVCLGRGADLVAAGLVDSLAHPGGNVTGLTSAGDRLGGKRLQLLVETAAPVSRVGVFWEANVGPFPYWRYEEPVRALGIQLVPLEASTADEFGGVFDKAVRERADALIVISTPLTGANRARVVGLAAQHRLPTMYDSDQYVREGGLMAYRGSTQQMEHRAAYYVDRILKGAKPADLPIEQPREFELLINAHTAQALGLTIPQHILFQATEVIQ